MQNVRTQVTGNELVITIDLSAPTVPSKTGKTLIIASTHGNAPVATHNGKPVTLGLNLYRKP